MIFFIPAISLAKLLTGIVLAILSWGALLILLLASCIVYGYRIRVEYISHVKETKMLIPFII